MQRYSGCGRKQGTGFRQQCRGMERRLAPEFQLRQRGLWPYLQLESQGGHFSPQAAGPENSCLRAGEPTRVLQRLPAAGGQERHLVACHLHRISGCGVCVCRGGDSATLHSTLSTTEVLPAVFNAPSAQKRVSKGCSLTRHLERHCICPLFTCFPNPCPAFKGTRRYLLGLPHLIPMTLRGRGA